jgi:hypothetical protein
MTPKSMEMSVVNCGPVMEIVFEKSARFVPSADVSEPEIVYSPVSRAGQPYRRRRARTLVQLPAGEHSDGLAGGDLRCVRVITVDGGGILKLRPEASL